VQLDTLVIDQLVTLFFSVHCQFWLYILSYYLESWSEKYLIISHALFKCSEGDNRRKELWKTGFPNFIYKFLLKFWNPILKFPEKWLSQKIRLEEQIEQQSQVLLDNQDINEEKWTFWLEVKRIHSKSYREQREKLTNLKIIAILFSPELPLIH
jgi:hypothetical protein